MDTYLFINTDSINAIIHQWYPTVFCSKNKQCKQGLKKSIAVNVIRIFYMTWEIKWTVTSFRCYRLFVMFCVLWYHLFNFKNVKYTHEGVLLLVKLYANLLKLYFTKSNTPPWVFFTFLKLYKWYQIGQRITIYY